LDSEFFIDSDSTLIDGILNDDIIINRRSTSTNRMDYMEEGVASDSDNSTYINIDIDIEEYIDIDEIDFDRFSDTEIDTNNDSDLESDIFSVTDDRYFAGNEEIRIIFWKYIAFYIIRSPISKRFNILFTIVTLFHIKGEDRKFRI
jgi:hypothetical protein